MRLIAGTAALGLGAAALLATGITSATATVTAKAVEVPPTQTVTLATGDRVTVTGSGSSRPGYQLEPGSGGGFMSYDDAAGDHYLVPVIAQPYLGRGLDPALFDVSALVRDGIQGSARTPVRLTFAAGSTPTAPAGISLTSTSGTSVTGYLTVDSARQLGAALKARAGADVAAGRHPGDSPLVAGLTGIALDAPGAPQQAGTPRYAMRNLEINAIGLDGAPDDAMVIIQNTDSQKRFATQQKLSGGMARIAVPVGHYLVFTAEPQLDEHGNPIAQRAVLMDNITVADGPTTTVTVDLRTAASKVSVSTPRPAEQDALAVTWCRFDAAGQHVTREIGSDGNTPIYVNAQPAVQTGKLHYLVQWGGSSQDPGEDYRYDVAFASDDGVPENQAYVARPDQLATVHHRIAADPADPDNAGFLYSGATDEVLLPVSKSGQMLGSAKSFNIPGQRLQYLGSAIGGLWQQEQTTSEYSMEAGVRRFEGGREYTVDWRHGPVVPGGGQFTGPGYPCAACRIGDTVVVLVPRDRDSEPDHSEHRIAVNDSEVAHLVLYRDEVELADIDHSLRVSATGMGETSRNHTFRAVLDLDRSRQATVSQSTNSHTEWTFNDAPAGTLPANDFCPAGDPKTPCQVLPMLTLDYRLATDLVNTSDQARQQLTMEVGHLRYDGAGCEAAIVNAEVSVSFDGGGNWQSATVSQTSGSQGAESPGAGRYQASWNNVAAARPMLRVNATDADGNKISQTITNAYTIAPTLR